MAVLFFVLCFEHKRQALKILTYSRRQNFPDLENKEIKPLDVGLILDIWINFLYKKMFVSPCPHWWQALRVCWRGKPQKHTYSVSYCYSQQSASLIYKYSQHYCPVVPFFLFLQNITTCTCNMLILIPNIFNKRGISIYLCKNMFNQSNSGLE